MSPLVPRPRVKAPARDDGTDEHWSVLLFESLSAGAVAVFVGVGVVMAVVSLYVIVVWPLTFWDLTNTGLEKYSSWVNTVLWSVFGGASLAGYWCFSGAAFRNKPAKKTAVVRGKSTRS
jgi:hypothetical protein